MPSKTRSIGSPAAGTGPGGGEPAGPAVGAGVPGKPVTAARFHGYNRPVKRALAVVLLVAAPAAGLLGQERVEQIERDLQTATGTERVLLLNRLSREVQNNSPRDSIVHATEALELAGEIGDLDGQATALNNLGIAHYYLADYPTALDYYERSLEIAERIEDDEAVAKALNNIGIIHYMWGEYDKSLEYYSRALELRRRAGDTFGIAVGHNNLGNVYYSSERYEQALEHLQEAFGLYNQIGNERLAASTLNNIGLLYHRIESYDDALNSLERALAIEERIDDRPGIALSLTNIGLVYEARGRTGEALDSYRRALRVREDIGDRQGIAVCLQNIGQAYSALGSFDEAIRYQNEALEIAEQLGVREIQRDGHLGLSETYERMGDFERALRSYQRYQEVNAELFNEETGGRLAELQARYEVEKKDRAIDGLVKDRKIQRTIRNAIVVVTLMLLILVVSLYIGYRLKARANREIRNAHEALKVAQAEREKAARAELAHVGRVATLGEMAAVLAHELNQPLTAILANAQATRRMLASDRAGREELDEALADIAAGAGHASGIIKRLRTLLRRGDVKKEPLDVNEAIHAVEAFAKADARQHGARLVLDLAPGLPEVLGDRVQIQQVVLNLVHNGAEAMATAPDSEREIVITSSLEDDAVVRIAVRDSGPAVDQAAIARLFEPFFTTKNEGLGMGLPICQTIVESHGGRLWASRNPDRGLTVQFTLPCASAVPA